jgi:hypothetical protein
MKDNRLLFLFEKLLIGEPISKIEEYINDKLIKGMNW